MNIIIFSLTVLLFYGILVKGYKAYKNADIEDKMEEIEGLEELNEEILDFKKAHKGDREKQRKIIKDFNKE